MEVLGITTEYLDRVHWSIRQILFVENETNLYLLPHMTDTLAIFSSGKALHLLKEISLFKNSEIYYWGDLDEEGFIMLNEIRNHYPHIKSLFMDHETVTMHESEILPQPSKYKTNTLDLLTGSEQSALEMMFNKNGRMEQERLQQAYVINKLETLLK